MNSALAYPDAVRQIIACFALHAFWQVPLLAGAAWCAIRIGKPHVKVAHTLWCGTLLLCVLLPLCSTIAARTAAIRAQREQADVRLDAQPYAGTLPAFARESRWARFLHLHISRRGGLQPLSLTVTSQWARGIAAGYLVVTLLFALRLAVSWRSMRQIVRHASREQIPTDLLERLCDHCDTLHIAMPECRMSGHVSGPAIAGVLRPVLLLPAANTFSGDEIEAVLAHEFAHLRRHDPLLHALCTWLMLPVSFHPVALWIGSRIRHTREMACDAEAAMELGSVNGYADALLRIAENARPATAPRWSTPGMFNTGLLGMFNTQGTMEERMRMLINENNGVVRGQAVRLAGCVTVTVLAVTAAVMLQVRPALAVELVTTQTPPTPQATAPLAGTGTQARTADQKDAPVPKANRASAQAAPEPDSTSPSVPPLDFKIDLPNMSDEPVLRAQIEKQQEVMKKLQEQMDSPAWKAQLEQQQKLAEQMQALMNSPEWKAHLDTQHKLAEHMHDLVNSPEWKERIRKQQEVAARITAQVNSPEWKARVQQSRLVAADMRTKMDSPEFRAQIDAAMKLAQNSFTAFSLPESRFSAPAEGQPLKISAGVLASSSAHKENPVYPAEAKQKGTQGAVVLHVLVDETGEVEQVSMISSPDPSLTDSAITAVKQWTYKPFLLNGSAVPVESTVTVTYSLAK